MILMDCIIINSELLVLLIDLNILILEFLKVDLAFL